MNTGVKEISKHMRELGLCTLAHANYLACYTDYVNGGWPEMSVLHAAHAAELLIKARIAEEHPLLVFDHLPKLTQSETALLDLKDLFRHGRTTQWSNLPDRLWSVTGMTIPNVEEFEAFGRLRNVMQHFAPGADEDPGGRALEFIFRVIDPFINECWGLYAIDYDEELDCKYIYLTGPIISRQILFLVSPRAAETFPEWDVCWDQVQPEYRQEMRKRALNAGYVPS